MMNKHFLERIKEAAHKTYNVIAPDMFRVSETKTLSQQEVLEYVAMYMEYGNDPEATAVFQSMPEADQTDLLKEVFPEKEYRWEHKCSAKRSAVNTMAIKGTTLCPHRP